jgi:hypothetical protein
MKTLDTSNTRNFKASHIRMILAVVGILTAVLCAMALLQDVRAAELLNTRAPHGLEISKIMDSDLVDNVKISL